MSKTMRTARTLAALAATGTFAFTLSGCGSLLPEGEGAKESAKPAAEETSKAAEKPSEEASSDSASSDAASSDSSASDSASQGSDNGGDTAAGGKAEGGFVQSGFSEEDKKSGGEALSNLMTKMADSDFKGACETMAVDMGGSIQLVKDTGMVDGCASGMQQSASGDASGMKDMKDNRDMMKPENFKMQDDGSFEFMGNKVPNFKGVKSEKDGKVYILVSM